MNNPSFGGNADGGYHLCHVCPFVYAKLGR